MCLIFELLFIKQRHCRYSFLIYLKKVNYTYLFIGHSRPQDLLCYAKTNNKLGSNKLWLSLWGCLDKLGDPLKVASVGRIETKNV